MYGLKLEEDGWLKLNLLDEEVLAVILAITVVGSAIAIAQVLRPEIVEPFQALGILNEEMKIGEYPTKVYPGQNIELYVYVYNHKAYPALVQVRYKIGNRETLPTNTSPSSQPTIKVYEFLVDVKENVTKKVEIPITIDRNTDVDEIALIFELWVYDIDRKEWVYTGIWNHLYVRIVKVQIP
ncbi:MAG: DUF1616 domain-containing protein [Ignisphaera sp.]